jgi:hypothetical protein
VDALQLVVSLHKPRTYMLPLLFLLRLQVLNVQLQSEVKRMAALAGVTGQQWQPHRGQAVDTTAEQVGSSGLLKYTCIICARRLLLEPATGEMQQWGLATC